MGEDGSETTERDSFSFESDPNWREISKDFISELRTRYPGPPILWGYILVAIFGPAILSAQTTETGRWVQVTATILAFHEYLTYQVSLTIDAVSDVFYNFSYFYRQLISVLLIVLTNLSFAYPMLACGSHSESYVELVVLILLLIGVYWFVMFVFHFPLYWMGKTFPTNPEELREVGGMIPNYLSSLLSLDQEPSLRRIMVVGFLFLVIFIFIYHFDSFSLHLIVLFLLSIHPHTLELIGIIFVLGAISYLSPLLSSYAILIQYLGRFLVIFSIGNLIYFFHTSSSIQQEEFPPEMMLWITVSWILLLILLLVYSVTDIVRHLSSSSH